MKFTGLAILLVLLPSAAFAGQAEADACAAKLPKDPAAIYAAAVPQAKSGGNLTDIVTKVTRGMVLSGKLRRADAKPAAQTAGTCLILLRQ